MDYKETLNLPATEFPMKANLTQKEVEILEKWAAMGLYDKLTEAGRDKPKYILHDGPPYANGHIHIDDIVEGVVRVTDRTPAPNPEWSGDAPDPGTSYAPYRIYNIGNNNPVELLRFIEALEEKLGKKAIRNLLPLQPGDVPATCADVDDLMRDAGFRPKTTIEEGISRFVDWYRGYYSV